jgi:hypothetical protein
VVAIAWVMTEKPGWFGSDPDMIRIRFGVCATTSSEQSKTPQRNASRKVLAVMCERN